MLLNNLNVVFTLCIDSSVYTFAITCSLDLLMKNCAVLSMLCHMGQENVALGQVKILAATSASYI